MSHFLKEQADVTRITRKIVWWGLRGSREKEGKFWDHVIAIDENPELRKLRNQ